MPSELQRKAAAEFAKWLQQHGQDCCYPRHHGEATVCLQFDRCCNNVDISFSPFVADAKSESTRALFALAALYQHGSTSSAAAAAEAVGQIRDDRWQIDRTASPRFNGSTEADLSSPQHLQSGAHDQDRATAGVSSDDVLRRWLLGLHWRKYIHGQSYEEPCQAEEVLRK